MRKKYHTIDSIETSTIQNYFASLPKELLLNEIQHFQNMGYSLRAARFGSDIREIFFSRFINPFMPSGLFYLNSLDRLIFYRRGVCFFFFIIIIMFCRTLWT